MAYPNFFPAGSVYGPPLGPLFCISTSLSPTICDDEEPAASFFVDRWHAQKARRQVRVKKIVRIWKYQKLRPLTSLRFFAVHPQINRSKGLKARVENLILKFIIEFLQISSIPCKTDFFYTFTTVE